MNTNYVYEVKFYLTIKIYESFLKNKDFDLDSYQEIIDKIYEDYMKQYDNNKKSLLSSIEDYMQERKEFILELLGGII